MNDNNENIVTNVNNDKNESDRKNKCNSDDNDSDNENNNDNYNNNDNNVNNDNDNDNDRETLEKILFALFNAENGGYLRCPICNDNIKYTSPYTFSKHVCYAHNREYGSFGVAGITAVRIQDFIRLLQKFYPVTESEEYDRFYYIKKLSEQMQKQMQKSKSNSNAVA